MSDEQTKRIQELEAELNFCKSKYSELSKTASEKDNFISLCRKQMYNMDRDLRINTEELKRTKAILSTNDAAYKMKVNLLKKTEEDLRAALFELKTANGNFSTLQKMYTDLQTRNEELLKDNTIKNSQFVNTLSKISELNAENAILRQKYAQDMEKSNNTIKMLLERINNIAEENRSLRAILYQEP